MKEEIFTIGKVARTSGVGIETIRFYEREGLIPEPPRRASGYRQYPDSVVERIQFIKRAKELGFTLKEIEELLSLRTGKDKSCADVKRQAEAKIAEVDEKIHHLQKIRKALHQLKAACTGRGPTSECPILEALSPTSKRKR